MSFTGIICESFMPDDLVIVSESVFGTKITKKDLEDPEKIKECIKKIQNTPDEEFKKRGMASIVFSTIDIVINVTTFGHATAITLGVSALCLAISIKFLNNCTERDELAGLLKRVEKQKKVITKQMSKEKDPKVKKQYEATLDKYGKCIEKCKKAMAKARTQWG